MATKEIRVAGSRGLLAGHGVREKTLRRRRRRQLLLSGIVLGSALMALAWGALVERPRYAAETRFSVNGSSPEQGPAGPASSLLSGGAGGSVGVGFVDGFALDDFLKSRDCMLQVNKRVNLARLLRVNPADGTEALYRAYTRAVSIKFFMVEQENFISVSAFSPADSRNIATALIAIAQEFVARMDEEGVQSALNADAHQLEAAQDKALRAANAVAAWRASNRNIDPEAEANMLMANVGQLEQELNTARINYEKVEAFGNPNHPMLRPAQMQVAALEGQLDAAKARLAGGNDSEAARLRTYTELKNAQTFADNNLLAARDAYQQSYRETVRLRRYLSVIAAPISTDVPSSPNLPLLAVEGLLGGLVLAFLTSLAMSLGRATAHEVGSIQARRQEDVEGVVVSPAPASAA